MFIAAVAHKYSFPHEPFHINIPDYGNDRTWYNAFAAMWDMSDVQQDVTEHLGVVGSSLSRRLRGRTAYHLTRGTSETDHLISPNAYSYQGTNYLFNSASDSESSTATMPSTTKNRYGAVEAENTSNSDRKTSIGHHDGINIVKQTHTTKEYSPQYGVPKILGNYFQQQQPASSASSSMQYDRSTRSDNTSKSESVQNSSTTGGIDIKKSDSMQSDWLSTPTDELIGIDVKGKEKDRINFRIEPSPRT